MNPKPFFVAVLVAFALFLNSGIASAAHEVPLILVTPDGVTGQVVFKLNTGTNDPRLLRSCVYRVDANSPDPTVPVACADVSTGRAPVGSEIGHNGEGVVLEITVTVSILPEDQTFGVANIADAGGGLEVNSALSSNSATLPAGVVAPLFVVSGS